MSWHYLQGQVAASSEDCCTGGEPLLPLKSKTTHAAFYSNGKLTESYLDSLSGTMYARSTESRGEEKLMSSAVDSRVRTSHVPEKVQDSKGPGRDSGLNLPESLAKWDRNTSSWRTHQCLLFEDLTECLETLPKWGMTVGGECWAQTMPEHLTRESESGCWVGTPTMCDALGTVGRSERFKTKTPTPTEYAKTWPTPRAGNPGSRRPGTGGKVLSEEVKTWPTPTVAEATKIGAQANYGQVGLNNHPRIRGNPTREKMQKDRAGLDGGTKTQQTWPTPRCFMHKDALTDRGKSNLGEVINEKENMTKTGQLNPSWVEWLMGWPIGWTDLKPLAMDKYRQWLHSHGKC